MTLKLTLFSEEWFQDFVDSRSPQIERDDPPEVQAACIQARAILNAACVVAQSLDHHTKLLMDRLEQLTQDSESVADALRDAADALQKD